MHALIFEHFATNLYDRLSNKLIRTVHTTHEFAYIIYNLHRSINRVQLIEVEIDQIAIDSKLYRLHIRNRNNRDEKSKDDNPILLNANDETSKIGATKIKFLYENRSVSRLIFRFNTMKRMKNILEAIYETRSKT